MIYAGFFRRLLAYLIDALVIGALQLGLFAAAIPGTTLEPKAIATSLAVRGAATWAYFALMESSPLQATLGKLALGIRVEHEGGGPLTFRRASLRYYLKILSSLPLMIGWLMAAFTPRRQALHDLLAKSVVVRTDRTVAATAEHWDPSVPLLAEHWDGARWVSGPHL
jgi:uncharacterized RDD family membrane protein YckC